MNNKTIPLADIVGVIRRASARRTSDALDWIRENFHEAQLIRDGQSLSGDAALTKLSALAEVSRIREAERDDDSPILFAWSMPAGDVYKMAGEDDDDSRKSRLRDALREAAIESHPDLARPPPTDYHPDAWCRKDFWTIEEAAHLLNGMPPERAQNSFDGPVSDTLNALNAASLPARDDGRVEIGAILRWRRESGEAVPDSLDNAWDARCGRKTLAERVLERSGAREQAKRQAWCLERVEVKSPDRIVIRTDRQLMSVGDFVDIAAAGVASTQYRHGESDGVEGLLWHMAFSDARKRYVSMLATPPLLRHMATSAPFAIEPPLPFELYSVIGASLDDWSEWADYQRLPFALTLATTPVVEPEAPAKSNVESQEAGSASGSSLAAIAQRYADEEFLRARSHSTNPSKANIAIAVAKRLSNEGYDGKRGPLAASTVEREFLRGWTKPTSPKAGR